jgi:molybdate transport system substrate-binding protein
MTNDEGKKSHRSSDFRHSSFRHSSFVRSLALVLTVVTGCGDGGPPNTNGRVTLLAAASTADVVTEVAKAFKEETSIDVVISSGASNTLATQIIEGAPADVFLSANQKWADALKDKGLVEKSQPLLTNRLVLIVPKGNPDKVAAPADLAAPQVGKLALAGENVPAGMYADQALRALGLLEKLAQAKKIVRGQDVRVALTYVETGEASAGIVYATDAKISRKVEVVYTFPRETHDEMVYPVVLLKHSAENAAALWFFDYLCGDAAAAVFERHGFARLNREAE